MIMLTWYKLHFYPTCLTRKMLLLYIAAKARKNKMKKRYDMHHGLRTHNEGINQRYLKNWADVADKICCRHT